MNWIPKEWIDDKTRRLLQQRKERKEGLLKGDVKGGARVEEQEMQQALQWIKHCERSIMAHGLACKDCGEILRWEEGEKLKLKGNRKYMVDYLGQRCWNAVNAKRHWRTLSRVRTLNCRTASRERGPCYRG